MNVSSRNRCAHGARCVALVLAAGSAIPALAIDKSWMCNSGAFSEHNCWMPLGRPLPADNVFIGNRPEAQNNSVHMDRNEGLANLTISDGMSLETEGFRLVVTGDINVSGQNTVQTQSGPVDFPSRLIIANAGAGPDVEAESVTLNDHANLFLAGGASVRVEDNFTISSNASLTGLGSVEISGNGTSFRNESLIRPTGASGITLSQLADGVYDLDGTSGDGILRLDAAVGVLLAVHGERLTDAFSGRVFMTAESRLNMNLDDGWTTDDDSVISVTGVAGEGPARIHGSPVAFGGLLEVSGPDARVNFEETTTLNATAVAHVYGGAVAAFTGATTVLGGQYYLAEDARIRFEGDTELRGGLFTTFSTLFTQGSAQFHGDTSYNGDIVIDGVALQLGDATVIGASSVNATVFDMDGTGDTAWNIQNQLTINAGAINTAGTIFSGSMSISGGLSARLNMILDQSWTMGGAMNLTGEAALFATRVTGSPMLVTGDLTLTSGRVNISSSSVTFANSSQITIGPASAVLRLTAESEIANSADFLGNGTLQNGPSGDMTLRSGLSTGTVELVNQGTLHIGEGPGGATTDAFENTASGVWRVQVGGYAAVIDYDRLIVNGGAANLAGAVEVELLNTPEGERFSPVVGDTFMILTAVGGTTGAFASTAVSEADGYTYEWSVITNPNDVVLRLDAIIPPPCSADFNGDGVVNSQDFFDFLTRFFASSETADFNDDGSINSQDFFDFLNAFFGGC